MQQLKLGNKKAGKRAGSDNVVQNIRYKQTNGSSNAFLPQSRKIPPKPSNRVNEWRFERRRQRLIRGLLKASTAESQERIRNRGSQGLRWREELIELERGAGL
jgi:hypothetical protein